MARLHVAVGVILDDRQRVLVARRAAHRHQGGRWEFPGGKVEPGETVVQALCRELEEELAITPTRTSPMMRIEHDYPDRRVDLDVHRVSAWRGEPRGLEGQPLAWLKASELARRPFPQANLPIIRRLALPPFLIITEPLPPVTWRAWRAGSSRWAYRLAGPGCSCVCRIGMIGPMAGHWRWPSGRWGPGGGRDREPLTRGGTPRRWSRPAPERPRADGLRGASRGLCAGGGLLPQP